MEKIIQTFEEFRKTKKRLLRTEVDEPTYIEFGDGGSEFGLVYDNHLVIEEVKPSEEYLMVIGRCDFVSRNLDELEAKLWLFYCEEHDLFEEEIKIRYEYKIFNKNWYY